MITSAPSVEICSALAFGNRSIPSLFRVLNAAKQVVLLGVGRIGIQRRPKRANRGISLAIDEQIQG